MTRSTWMWPTIIIASALGIGLLAIGNLVSPIRPVLAFWFMLICPGMALVRLLRIEDHVRELTLAVAVSLTTGLILATTMIYAKLWSPKWGLGILIGISIIGAILQLITTYRVESQEHRQHQ